MGRPISVELGIFNNSAVSADWGSEFSDHGFKVVQLSFIFSDYKVATLFVSFEKLSGSILFSLMLVLLTT